MKPLYNEEFFIQVKPSRSYTPEKSSVRVSAIDAFGMNFDGCTEIRLKNGQSVLTLSTPSEIIELLISGCK